MKPRFFRANGEWVLSSGAPLVFPGGGRIFVPLGKGPTPKEAWRDYWKTLPWHERWLRRKHAG